MILADEIRKTRMMTVEERIDLINSGWKEEVINSLSRRGFRECGPVVNADGTKTPSFLRQTTLPHLHIALEKTATLEDVDNAIDEFSRREAHSALAGLFMRFFDQCKAWRPAPDNAALEKRLAVLEELHRHR